MSADRRPQTARSILVKAGIINENITLPKERGCATCPKVIDLAQTAAKLHESPPLSSPGLQTVVITCKPLSPGRVRRLRYQFIFSSGTTWDIRVVDCSK